jgi:hypothetical protein
MFYWQMAVAVLLVCTVSPLQVVTGTCTDTQKARVMFYCHTFTKKGSTINVIHIHSDCCVSVRLVPNSDMKCVVSMLTDKEKEIHDEERIWSLETLCEYHPPYAPSSLST